MPGVNMREVSMIPAKSYITGNAMSLDDIDSNQCNKNYLYYTLCNRGLDDIVSGSAQPQIIGKDIRRIMFLLPSLEEQENISKILLVLDYTLSTYSTDLVNLKKSEESSYAASSHRKTPRKFNGVVYGF